VSGQPSFAAAWLNLGFILQAEGDMSQARADWSKAVVLDPTLATRIPRVPTAPIATPKS
jgi:hypothetical protein